MSLDESKSSSPSHPPWHGPFGPSSLHVLNSLTGRKEAFVPLHPPHVSWYICGPTVYDSAHLGHARAYVTFDVLRRLLSDYFRYDVHYVMNITDIDDKIIVRARKNHLLTLYRAEKEAAQPSALPAVIADIRQAYDEGVATLQAKRAANEAALAASKSSRHREELQELMEGEAKKLSNLSSEQSAFLASVGPSSSPPASLSSLVSSNASALSDLLDRRQGHTVTEPSIFLAHAQRFEREFLDDMRALNVREPDAVTRVTEYIPDIIAFVQRIIDRGIAYHSNGSVYFSVHSFQASTSPPPATATDPSPAPIPHSYGKLSPASVGNASLAAEGEGQLSASSTGDKRHPSDFALWKSSKPGEPSWPSPWGQGRPGWHIECFGEDTRVLTNRGFLFLDELEAAAADSHPLLYACYDVRSDQWVYRPGQLVLPPAGTHSSLIEFTQANEARRWAAGSDAYGRGLQTEEERSAQTNRLSIRTTADHDLFVQVGRYDSSDHPRYGEGRRPAEPHAKQRASALAADPNSCVRFLACAVNGRATSADDSTSFALEMENALGLTGQQIAAFLEVYGFWLGDGSLSFNHGGKKGGVSAVIFNQVKGTDLQWLQQTLPLAGLRRDVDWRITGTRADGSCLVAIVAQAWVVYFYREYSKKYAGAVGALLVEEEDEDGSDAFSQIVGCPVWIPVKSAKWFWWWVRWLSKEQLRLVIRGLHRADGDWACAGNSIFTSSVSFRDELLVALLHAGYSAFFDLQHETGTVKRWVRRAAHRSRSGAETLSPDAHAALPAAEQVKYYAVKASVDGWKVCWAEPMSTKDKGACWPSLDGRTDIASTPYTGRTWCVTVQHRDHLIVAHRAERDTAGIVTKASQPIIIGQCSAMATDVIGGRMDVHSGGSDLKFPHHDNELAQSEAALGVHQWVNHFWHAGQLSIKGLKMSKSLKNFITIRQVLQQYTPLQIRLLFLLSPWDASINFTEDSLATAKARETELNEFFLNSAVVLRAKRDLASTPQHWTPDDRRLQAELQSTRDAVHAALCDNFDYSTALLHLSSLIQSANKYRQGAEAKRPVLLSIVRYVDRLCRVLGLKADDEFGFTAASSADDAALLDALCGFRDEVRNTAREWKARKGEEGQGLNAVLSTCDRMRDGPLIDLGVRIEDPPEPGRPSVWKREDAGKLRRERAVKKKEEADTRVKGLVNRLAKARKELEKLEEGRVSPREWYAGQTGKYGAWNEEGRPTADGEGKELSKSAVKAVEKVWQAKEKAHAEWRAKVDKSPRVMEELREEMERLAKQREAAEAELKRMEDELAASSAQDGPASNGTDVAASTG